MKKYQVPDPAEYDHPDFDNAAHDAIVEWLHTMTQEWDGDPGGVMIYPPLGSNGEVGEASVAFEGDWVVEENGVFRVVKAADYDKFMEAYRFQTVVKFSRLEETIDVKMKFEESELVQVEFKLDDAVLIMGPPMFFALLGHEAQEMYETAAAAEQNERLMK